MMRKKGGIIIILFVLILGLITGYLYVNKNRSTVEFDLYQNIPRNSSVIVAIGHSGIQNSIMGSFMLTYLEEMFSSNKSQQLLLYKEIISNLRSVEMDSIEKSLICIYPKDSIYSLELLIRVNAENEELQFMKNLLKKYHFSLLETELKSDWVSDSVKCTVQYNNEFLRIQTDLVDVDVVEDKNVKRNREFSIDQIKKYFNNNQQVCLWIKEDAAVLNNIWIRKHPEIFMNVQFLMNKVNLSAEFKSQNINKIFKSESSHVSMNDSSELQFWCFFNKQYFNTSAYLKESILIKIDSYISTIGFNISMFEENYNGDLSFEKGKDVEIQESYRTYSYDDYFNKIEKINYKTSVLPQFTGHIGVDDDLLYTRLKDKGLIKTKNKEQILVNIPICEIQTLPSLNNIVFSSPSIGDSHIQLVKDSIPFFFKSKLSSFNQMQIQMSSTDSSVVLEGHFKIDF